MLLQSFPRRLCHSNRWTMFLSVPRPSAKVFLGSCCLRAARLPLWTSRKAARNGISDYRDSQPLVPMYFSNTTPAGRLLEFHRQLHGHLHWCDWSGSIGNPQRGGWGSSEYIRIVMMPLGAFEGAGACLYKDNEPLECHTCNRASWFTFDVSGKATVYKATWFHGRFDGTVDGLLLANTGRSLTVKETISTDRTTHFQNTAPIASEARGESGNRRLTIYPGVSTHGQSGLAELAMTWSGPHNCYTRRRQPIATLATPKQTCGRQPSSFSLKVKIHDWLLTWVSSWYRCLTSESEINQISCKSRWRNMLNARKETCSCSEHLQEPVPRWSTLRSFSIPFSSVNICDSNEKVGTRLCTIFTHSGGEVI